MNLGLPFLGKSKEVGNLRKVTAWVKDQDLDVLKSLKGVAKQQPYVQGDGEGGLRRLEVTSDLLLTGRADVFVHYFTSLEPKDAPSLDEMKRDLQQALRGAGIRSKVKDEEVERLYARFLEEVGPYATEQEIRESMERPSIK